MADGKTHNQIGKAAGAIVALARTTEDDTFWDALFRAIGGYLGGSVGSALPDFLEPAIHSFHRDVAHSFTAAIGVVELTRRVVDAWEQYCRTKARDAAGRRVQPAVTDGDKLASFAEEVFWKMAVGFAAGVAAGYVSHLALDAGTPRGIPLLTRGF